MSSVDKRMIAAFLAAVCAAIGVTIAVHRLHEPASRSNPGSDIPIEKIIAALREADFVASELDRRPEMLMSAALKLQAQKKQPESQPAPELVAETLDAAGAVETMPAREAEVTIVEFFDYNCPYCRSVAATIEKLAAEPGVRIVYREMPILSDGSRDAARIALALADKPGLYAEFHHRMMKSEGAVNGERALEIARALGADIKTLEELRQNPEIERTIERNLDLARRLGVRGTPTFLVENHIVRGAVSEEEMRKIVEAVRKKSKTE